MENPLASSTTVSTIAGKQTWECERVAKLGNRVLKGRRTEGAVPMLHIMRFAWIPGRVASYGQVPEVPQAPIYVRPRMPEFPILRTGLVDCK